MKHWLLAATAAALLCCLPAPSRAQQPPSERWQWTIVPYLMGAGMSGTAGIAGKEAEVNVSASDVFKHLKFGAMGVVAARKGNWGFGSDGMWMSLDAASDSPPVDVTPKQGAFAFYGMRRLAPYADLAFGARWNYLHNEAAFGAPVAKTLDDTKQWLDPIVGVNLHSAGAGRWHARLYAEVGGFGVGSKLAWQVFPTIGFRVAKRASLDFGYRWLDVDYESGENLTYFKYDVLSQGPVLGFGFTF